MKLKLFVVFILLTTFMYSQKAEVVKIKRKEIEKAGKLADILKDIPTNCEIKSYVFSIVFNGSESSLTIKGQELNEFRYILLNVNTKQFFIEKIQSNCKPRPKSRYKVIIED